MSTSELSCASSRRRCRRARRAAPRSPMSPRATEVLARHHRQVGEELLVLLSPRGQVDLVGHLGEGEVRGDLVFVWLDLGGVVVVLGLRLVLIARVGAKGRRGAQTPYGAWRTTLWRGAAWRSAGARGWGGGRLLYTLCSYSSLYSLVSQQTARRASSRVSACPPYRLQRIRSRTAAAGLLMLFCILNVNYCCSASLLLFCSYCSTEEQCSELNVRLL